MNLKKIKVGYRLWYKKKNTYGRVVKVGKTGWVTLDVRGKLVRAWHTHLCWNRPKDQKLVLFDELSEDQQREVNKRSSSCNLPVRTVMVEMGLTEQ